MAQITNEVLAERMEGLKAFFTEKFNENKIEHKAIQEAQNHTNGSVTELEKFKIQAKIALLFIGVIITGVAVPLLYKFLEIKIFGK